MSRVRPSMLAIGAIVGVGIACGSSSTTSPSGSTTSVGSIIGSVAASGGTPVNVPQSGSPPTPSGGPTGAASGGSGVVGGGSGVSNVSGSGTFSSVDVSVGTSSASAPVTSGLGGIRPAATTTANGFFQVNLPGPVTNQRFIVTFARNLPVTSFTLQFQLISPTGAVGPVASLPMTVHSVASGSLQVSVAWDQASAIGLQVVEPSGNDISAANPGPSSTGGRLDLTSNVNCTIDNIDTEDVGWPSGTTPATGSYLVRLNYVATCGAPTTNFVVTVNNNGTVTTFPGTFTSDLVDGGKGNGHLITTFTFGTPTLQLFARPVGRRTR